MPILYKKWQFTFFFKVEELYLWTEFPWPENPANAVSILLGLINSIYHDLHHGRSNPATTNWTAETLQLSH